MLMSVFAIPNATDVFSPFEFTSGLRMNAKYDRYTSAEPSMR
jgi:hypothetical protein